MDEERRGLVHYADDRNRRGSVLDPPWAKRLGHVSRKHDAVLTGT